MARREVVEVNCDRCGRTETQTSTEIPKSTGPEVEVIFHGEKTVFGDLCKRCRDAVRGYTSRLAKKVDDSTKIDDPVDSPTPAPSPTTSPEPKKYNFLGIGR